MKRMLTSVAIAAVLLITAWMLGGRTLAVAAAAGLAGGMISNRFARLLTAEEFRLVDVWGRLRARLSCAVTPGIIVPLNQGGPGLDLYYENGQKAVSVATDEGAAVVSLYGPGGQPNIGLAVSPDGSLGFSINDGRARTRVILGLSNEGETAFVLTDENGNEIHSVRRGS